WSRPPDEVRDLLDLLGGTNHRGLRDLADEGVRVRFVGRRDRLSTGLLAEMDGLERQTAENEALDLFVCFDYGGRDELVEAARRLVRDGGAEHESRVSNFLLFQIAYAEFVFTDALWPDFGRDDLAAALAEYARRRRRFGGR